LRRARDVREVGCDHYDRQAPHSQYRIQAISSGTICLLRPEDRIASSNSLPPATAEMLRHIHQKMLSLVRKRDHSTEGPVILRESQNRIRSMAMIHQKPYEAKDFARVDFRNFLQTMVPTVMSSCGVDPCRIVPIIRAADVQLPIKAAVPCGLVINELVSNVLKHAFPEGRHGAIEIALRRGPGREVVLSVSDGGIGLPDSFDLGNTATLGMQLLSLPADQIGAGMSVKPVDPTQFSFRFSVE
jgi:two-component system, sensor histidine kinase PdtaS